MIFRCRSLRLAVFAHFMRDKGHLRPLAAPCRPGLLDLVLKSWCGEQTMMGRHFFQSFAVLAGVSVAFLSASSTAQVSDEVFSTQSLSTARLSTTAPRDVAVIDFENVQGPQSGVGIELSRQYEASHGLRFGRGASVHFCARMLDDVNASLCSYPQAASGRRVAAHDVRSGGPAMLLEFTRPVTAVSVRINPTGGIPDEIFMAELVAFDATGARAARSVERFSWTQEAFTWPTRATLNGDGARITRVSIALRRLRQNNQPVRFLIDDLAFQYAPSEEQISPVAGALSEQEGPVKVAQAEIVQSPEVGRAQSRLRLYPAATRKRTVVDWDAVEAAVARQKDLDLAAAPYRGVDFVKAAELPLLLPSRADAGSVLIVGNKDSYNAHFKRGGVAYSLYGSRLLTVIGKSPGAPANNEAISFMGTEEALTASFSLYGVSYALTRHCADESATGDPACHNRDALGSIAADLVVVVGDAGGARP